MIESLIVSIEDVIPKLNKLIPDLFTISKSHFEKQLKSFVDCIRDGIYVFIEFPYVDKTYRDSYYTYYSKKHKSILRDSFRLSFFDCRIEDDDFRTQKRSEHLRDKFLGYLTIRPTSYRIIGNTIISPKAFTNNNFVCCLTKKEILVNGIKLEVHGFPFSSQDNETITCAETCIINLMEYFGTKYSEYSTILPSQIHELLSEQSFERQLPSNGLPTENISFVLKKLGFGTRVYNAKTYANDNSFREILFNYVESGIPVIAILKKLYNHHSILIVGRNKQFINSTKKPQTDLKSLLKKSQSLICPNTNETNISVFSDYFNELVIIDDNIIPYKLVDLNKLLPSKNPEIDNIISIIVPLYPKIHLEAFQFKKMLDLLNDEFKKTNKIKINLFEDGRRQIIRSYITSSRSYKSFIALHPDIVEIVKDFVVEKTMPRFIWIAEVFDYQIWNEQLLVDKIIAVDATESGFSCNLLFAIDEHYIVTSVTPEEIESDVDLELGQDKDIDGTTYNIDLETIKIDGIYTSYEINGNKIPTFAGNLKGTHTLWKS